MALDLFESFVCNPVKKIDTKWMMPSQINKYSNSLVTIYRN